MYNKTIIFRFCYLFDNFYIYLPVYMPVLSIPIYVGSNKRRYFFLYSNLDNDYET